MSASSAWRTGADQFRWPGEPLGLTQQRFCEHNAADETSSAVSRGGTDLGDADEVADTGRGVQQFLVHREVGHDARAEVVQEMARGRLGEAS